MRRFPASVHTDNIQQKLVGSLVLLKASQCLARQSTFWVPNHRSHNALQEQQQGEHWPEKFPWQLTVREVFRGWVTGLDATTIENEKLKKGEWLCDNQVLFLVHQSHKCWFFLIPSSSVLSRALCTFDRVKTHANTHWCVRSSWSFLQTLNKRPSWRIRRITLKPKPP